MKRAARSFSLTAVSRPSLLLLAAMAACSGGSHSGESATDGGSDSTSMTMTDGGGSSDGSVNADAGDAKAADSGSGTCAPNATVPCTCTTPGDIGMQQCLPDGSAWRACACQAYGTQFAVSPSGSDTNPGTLAAPFKTLGRAQLAVRALSEGGLPSQSVVVWVRAGSYAFDQTLAFTASDSGTSAAPVIWSGYPGEVATLVGGQTLAPSAFTTVTSASPIWSRLDPSAQGNLVMASLSAQGVTDYGTLKERGFCQGGNTSALELSINGAAMPLARWPDADANTPAQTDTGSSITVYGTGVTPDVTGAYAKTGTADGVSAYARSGLVGGKQYNLFRWTNGSTTAWFLTTTAVGSYPSNTDPWWYLYASNLGAMTANNGASGAVGFADPSAVDYGFAYVTSAPSQMQFGFEGTRPARWSQATDVWVHGMFAYDWADCHQAVTSIDPTGQTITLAGVPGYPITTQGLWYAENLLEEITEPGEWYLDRSTGNLYLWPPSSLTGATIEVSTLSTPLVSINGTSNVTFRALTFESGRAQLIDIAAGDSLQLLGLTLRNSGMQGVTLDGTNITVAYAHVYGNGDGGIYVSGGDRPSLTPGNNAVENSNIHNFGRWEWMYQPGVSLNDAGNRASNNKIHDSPHAAILYGGNNHTMELNDIYNACMYTADAGAIYSGRDWGARGNAIKNNYLHGITSFLSTDVNAIYLDDCLSGILVQGNIVDTVGAMGILHGGGRDNIMTDNVFARCGAGALYVDARCYTSLPSGTPNDTPGSSWDLLGKLEADDYQQNPWATAFPACAAIPDDWNTIIAPDAGWLLPQGSEFSRNLGFANNTWIVQADTYGIPAYAAVSDNVYDAGNVFVNEDGGNLNLTPASVADVPGLQTVPFSSIGIQP